MKQTQANGEAAKELCTKFYFWWHNQKGTNTYQGFDSFATTDEGKKLIASLAASLPESSGGVVVEDLQDQVREHIKAHNLFDWHEALTNAEMIYLENLLLTFAPMFSPGSIGFEKSVKPYLIHTGEGEGAEIIENLRADRNQYREAFEKRGHEIERLKGLINDAVEILDDVFHEREPALEIGRKIRSFKIQNKL